MRIYFNMNSSKNLNKESLQDNSVSGINNELYHDFDKKSSCSYIYENNKDNLSSIENLSVNSNSNFKGTISSSLEDNFLLKSIIYGKIYCTNCQMPCAIIFNDNLDLSFDCGCSLKKHFSINDFLKDYLHNGKTGLSFADQMLHCQIHPKETNLICYCVDCEYDLCKECLKDNSPNYSNTETYKKHINHELINLNKIQKKFENINNLISKYEITMDFITSSEYYNEIIKNIFVIIKSLMESYQQFKCYNSYKSIENAELFLEKINNPNKYNFQIDKNTYPSINYIKITSADLLNDNITNFSNKIISIIIKESPKPIELSAFKNIIFPNLKQLILVKDKIKDISPFFSCEFPILEKLDLAHNEIDNTVIALLKKLNLPELNFLNLFINKITSLEILELIEKFNKLTTLYIGENKLETENNPKSLYKFPESLEIIGLTGNFTGENAEFVKKLDLENLKSFFFSRNKINNLKYIKNIKFKRLEEFWAICNEITDIKEIMNIQNKENIKIINLKNNNIKNFGELFDIIEYFPKLEDLTLIGNFINKSEVIDMKKKIKEKYKRKINIVI